MANRLTSCPSCNARQVMIYRPVYCGDYTVPSTPDDWYDLWQCVNCGCIARPTIHKTQIVRIERMIPRRMDWDKTGVPG